MWSVKKKNKEKKRSLYEKTNKNEEIKRINAFEIFKLIQEIIHKKHWKQKRREIPSKTTALLDYLSQ